MEVVCGELTFASNFDSGNLARVQICNSRAAVSTSHDTDGKYAPSSYLSKPDYEYQVWTNPDAAGTPYQNHNRTWFHFSVRGYSPGKLIQITVMNLNRQSRLYNQGYSVIYRTAANIQSDNMAAALLNQKWCRVRDRPTYEMNENQFQLTFQHRFNEPWSSVTYFAFCYPWSYTQTMSQLSLLDSRFQHSYSSHEPNLSSTMRNPWAIYYHRELLCWSLDHLRVELITISDCHGLLPEREPRFDEKLFPDTSIPRCHQFTQKKVIFISSRVHPGETPASHVFNGALEFLLRENDPRARQLRRLYVFKLIPLLNPDGVARGHYRTDSRGVNLNRVYLDPDFERHPSIYAAKSILVYHHIANRVRTVLANEKLASLSITEESPSSLSMYQHISPEKDVDFISPSPILTSQPASVVPVQNEFSEDLKSTERDQIGLVNSKVDSFVENTSISSPHIDAEHESSINPCNTNLHLSPPDIICNSSGGTSIYHRPNAAIINVKSSSNIKLVDRPDVVVVGGVGTRKTHSLTHSRVGNEGSDGDSEVDDMDDCVFDVNNLRSPHLCRSELLTISARDSGIALYIDLHGHCSKRGCFMYGNSLEDENDMVENMLYTRLISCNSPHFDYTGCNFTVRNMYQKDKRDGVSKEGAGRVAIWKHLGLVHSYTLECNYNTGRMMNNIAAANVPGNNLSNPVSQGFTGTSSAGDSDVSTRAPSPPQPSGTPPRYTPQHFEGVGRAMLIAVLDMIECNPWSRIHNHNNNKSLLQALRDSVRRQLKNMPGAAANQPKSNGSNSNNSTSNSSNNVNRTVPLLASGFSSYLSLPCSLDMSTTNVNSTCKADAKSQKVWNGSMQIIQNGKRNSTTQNNNPGITMNKKPISSRELKPRTSAISVHPLSKVNQGSDYITYKQDMEISVTRQNTNFSTRGNRHRIPSASRLFKPATVVTLFSSTTSNLKPAEPIFPTTNNNHSTPYSSKAVGTQRLLSQRAATLRMAGGSDNFRNSVKELDPMDRGSTQTLQWTVTNGVASSMMNVNYEESSSSTGNGQRMNHISKNKGSNANAVVSFNDKMVSGSQAFVDHFNDIAVPSNVVQEGTGKFMFTQLERPVILNEENMMHPSLNKSLWIHSDSSPLSTVTTVTDVQSSSPAVVNRRRPLPKSAIYHKTQLQRHSQSQGDVAASSITQGTAPILIGQSNNHGAIVIHSRRFSTSKLLEDRKLEELRCLLESGKARPMGCKSPVKMLSKVSRMTESDREQISGENAICHDPGDTSNPIINGSSFIEERSLGQSQNDETYLSQ